MSTTSGWTLAMASASVTTRWNSRSTSSTLVSLWSRMKAIIAASSRVLSEFSTPPVIGTPKCASYISGMLGAMIATVSPVPMPTLSSAEASCRQRA